MNLVNFEHLLLLHGSDLDTWPDPAAAHAFAKSDRAAALLLEEQRQLDHDLAAAVAPGLMRTTTLSRLAARPRRRAVTEPWLSRPALAGIVIIICLAGFGAGQLAEDRRSAADLALVALATGDFDLLQEIN